MKELDLVLARYLEGPYGTAEEDERACFRRLLEMQDPQLYRLILGKDQSDDREIAQLLEVLRQGIGE